MVGTTPGNPAPGPPQLRLAEKRVCTPLRHSQFESELASHHDKAWVSWLLNGITCGVSIGFSGPHTPYVSSNLPSAAQHPHIITAELAKEVKAGRVLGPYGFATIPMSMLIRSPADPECLRKLGHTCGELFDKLEGPSTRITFLGIMLDTEARVVSLPQGKLEEIQSKVHSWLGRRSATKHELLSLIGTLSFVTKVVHAGRLFLHRLIDLSTTVERLHHHVHLSAEARADLDWWARFLPTWNGRAMFLEPQWSDADSLNLFTDASGAHGFGAFFEGSWLKGY